MEAAKERAGLLDKILPPALADAGLEDCALPPDSIQEAFRKAADAVKSRAASLFEHDDDEEEGGGGCVADPRPGTKETKPVLGGSDTIVVGGGENGGDAGPCLVGKGNGKMEDALVVAGEGGEEGKSCGDGLRDVDVEGVESSREEKDQSEEDEEEEKKKPILVEGFV